MKELLNLLETFWAIPKNQRTFMLFLGVSIVGCVFIFQVINVKQEDAVAARLETSALKDKTQKTMLQQVDGNENKIMRDPFAVPGGFRQKKDVPVEQESKKIVENQKPSSIAHVNKLPILTGLIGSDNRFIAILEYGDVSKQCLLDDSIGPYKVVWIDEENVILNGPSGAITLTVGR